MMESSNLSFSDVFFFKGKTAPCCKAPCFIVGPP